jgi:hypothetical protein
MRKPRIEIRVLCVLQKVNSEVCFVFYVPWSINLEGLVERFGKGTAGRHLKYVGCEADTNKQVTFIGSRFTSPSTVLGGRIFVMILLS